MKRELCDETKEWLGELSPLISEEMSLIYADPQPSEESSSGESQQTYDPCSPGEGVTGVCEMLGTAEGRGSYTQKSSISTASGRYQFKKSTAIGEIVKLKGVSESEAGDLWAKCGLSAAPECKQLQDDMCAQYSKYLGDRIVAMGYEPTTANRYLAWNQGEGGFKTIMKSKETGIPISPTEDKTVWNNMHRQAWTFTSDGGAYYNNMKGYLKKQGLNPD